MSVQTDTASQHEDLSDFFQRFHIVEGEIIIIGYEEHEDAFTGGKERPDG